MNKDEIRKILALVRLGGQDAEDKGPGTEDVGLWEFGSCASLAAL